MVHTPFGDQKTKGLVFIQHGFCGHKNEPQLQFIVNIFTQKGFSAVIFDGTNSAGESDCTQQGITCTSHCQDLEDVIQWASDQKWYQEPFILLGHSLGGFSAIHFTQNHPDKVKQLILLDPVTNGQIQYESMRHRMGPLFDLWEKQGYFIKESHSGGASRRVPFNYALDLKTYDAYRLIDRLKNDTVIINGDKDTSIPLKSSINFYQALTCPKSLKIIPNGDHSMRQPEQLKFLEKYILEIINKQK